jgi:hypothetical protein
MRDPIFVTDPTKLQIFPTIVMNHQKLENETITNLLHTGKS